MDSQPEVERLAKLAHEANRAYCELLGDKSQAAWEDSPEWQRTSVRLGVQNILDNPDLTPEQSHSKWVQHKTWDGWRYGPEKDVEKKEHPCMMPYSQLSVAQRFKDYLFQCVVKAGMKV